MTKRQWKETSRAGVPLRFNLYDHSYRFFPGPRGRRHFPDGKKAGRREGEMDTESRLDSVELLVVARQLCAPTKFLQAGT